MRAARLIAGAVAAVALAASAGAATSPDPFHLSFNGSHNAALSHEGTFTSSSPLCAAGSAADVSVDSTTDTSMRRFTCSGGGSFTAEISPLPAEHGGNGVWQIVAGSGPLADFRGKGTFSSTRLSGSSDDPATITFQSTWIGVAGFDATPPAIEVTGASARKLKRPKGAYSLRVVASFPGEDNVSYLLQVADPRKPGNAFVYKVAKTTTATATFTSRIKPPKSTRRVQVRIDAEDAVGNAATVTKTIRLR